MLSWLAKQSQTLSKNGDYYILLCLSNGHILHPLSVVMMQKHLYSAVYVKAFLSQLNYIGKEQKKEMWMRNVI